MTAILEITDGTTTVSLLDQKGLMLKDWRQGLPGFKNEGVWQDSPLADGRRLAVARYQSVIDEFTLTANGSDQDLLVHALQSLFELLNAAVDYWVTPHNNTPVWIKAQATCETNPRYALITSWRMPDAGNPYSMPFLQLDGAVMDDVSLFVEHGFWMANEPKEYTVVGIGNTTTSGMLEYTKQYEPVVSADDVCVNVTTTTVDLAYPLLSVGVLSGETFAFGIRFPAVEVPNGATITNAYITLRGYTGDLSGAVHATITAEDVDDAAVFSTWADFNGRASTTASYAWSPTGSGIIQQYSTGDLSTIIQEIVDRVGWSSGNDIAILVKDNSSTQIFFAYGHDSDFDPPILYIEYEYAAMHGQEETTLDATFVSNQHIQAQITHVYSMTAAGVFSVNLDTAATPFEFLPSHMGVGDCAFFGINSTAEATGPFCSLVFDLIPAALGSGLTLIWEYGTAHDTWATLTTKNSVSNFGVGDVQSVHWVRPSNWIATEINGVTAWWVRARVTAVNALQDPPQQQNRAIYTAALPYIDYSAAQVLGDLPALGRAQFTNTANLLAGPYIYGPQRVLMAARRQSRGMAFSPYLYASDEQLPNGITFTASTHGAIAAAADYPTGRKFTYTPLGASEASALCGYWTFNDVISNEYIGRFRVFLVLDVVGGAAADYSVELSLIANCNTVWPTMWTSETKPPPATDTHSVIEFGEIVIPSWQNTFDTLRGFAIYLKAGSTASWTAGSLDVLGVILMPTDEYIGDFIESADRDTNIGNWNTLRIDSVTNPKKAISASIATGGAASVSIAWQSISTSFLLQQKHATRLFWLFLRAKGVSNPNIWIHQTEMSGKVMVWKSQRYLSMRGAG